MDSRLNLFNRQLERNGIDVGVNADTCKALIKDIPNQGLKESKYMYIPNRVDVAIGDTITSANAKYMIININNNGYYHELVVEEIYHFIKVKYSWMDLMELNCMVDVKNQTMIDNTYLVAEKTSIEVQVQRNELSKQIRKGTRFFVFDVPYEVTSITYQNGNILSFKCDIDQIHPSDDTVNQIADNSQFTPPKVEYVITSSAGANGSISPLGSIKVEEGKSQIFTITPNDGYEIDTVLVDGSEVTLSNNQYTFANVSVDHTINATFKEIPVAENLTIVNEDGMEHELYIGYPQTYYLKDSNGGNKSPVEWSIDVAWCTINQDGTKCVLQYDDYSHVYEWIVLSGLYNGTTYTKRIETTKF